MKLAVPKPLQNADILLMDEPTNHLDVMNVKWVKDYIKSHKCTCIMVSHDSGFKDVCNHILEIADLKLSCFKGNLAAFVKCDPKRGPTSSSSQKTQVPLPAAGADRGLTQRPLNFNSSVFSHRRQIQGQGPHQGGGRLLQVP